MSVKNYPGVGKGFISEQPVEKPVFLDNDSGPNATIPSSPPIPKLPGITPPWDSPQPTDTFESIRIEGLDWDPFDFDRLTIELGNVTPLMDFPEGFDKSHWQTSAAQGNTTVTMSVTPLCNSTSPLFTKLKNQCLPHLLSDGLDGLDELDKFGNSEIAIGLDYLPDDVPFANPSDFKMEWFSGDPSQRPH
jgi:hypothetical protein